MFTLIVENSRGERLNLTESKNYDLLRVDGLTPPTAAISTAVVGTMDGEKFNTARLNKRNPVLTIRPHNPVEENRINLYKWFSPKHSVKLYYSNGQRKVFTQGYVESVAGSLFDNPQTFQISIICPDAYLYDQTEIIQDASYAEALFEFPFAIDAEGVELSTYDNIDTIVVLNDSDTETGVTIRLTASGDVVNPIIYRRDTLESFGLNVSMRAGDVIEIDTRRGRKGVTLYRDGGQTNIINHITKNVTWFQLLPGDNQFTYTAESGEFSLTATFIYNPRYEGV